LAREQGDVLVGNFSAAAKRLLLYLGDEYALTSKRGAHDVLTAGAQFSANLLAAAVLALPGKY